MHPVIVIFYEHVNNAYERGLKNTTNKVCKLQLEVTKSARDRLKFLSDADGLSQSKYIEGTPRKRSSILGVRIRLKLSFSVSLPI